ncbi:MAG TPA: NAD(P)H-binding protein [Solirubrobacteraceae bacterium]|nr:NAD(P)H-binding protein [Solirubrobacteraceae bacterium]
MRIVIAGGHGKIGLRLTRILAARGEEVAGLVRNPDHAADVTAAGGQPVICDLEHATADEVAAAVGPADAVVFAAGAGAGSGAERKLTMDRDGAITLLRATAGAAPRYVMISAVGAEAPPAGDGVFEVYLRAKAEADAAVMGSDRDWVILRPGRLTDEPGAGTARIDIEPFRGEISRDDVAAVLAAVLQDRRADGRILYVNGGRDSIDEALAAAVG